MTARKAPAASAKQSGTGKLVVDIPGLPASFYTAVRAITADAGFWAIALRMDELRAGCRCRNTPQEPDDPILEQTARRKSSDPAAATLARWFGYLMMVCCGTVRSPPRVATPFKALSADPAVEFLGWCVQYLTTDCCAADVPET